MIHLRFIRFTDGQLLIVYNQVIILFHFSNVFFRLVDLLTTTESNGIFNFNNKMMTELKKNRIGIVFDKSYLAHDNGPTHPESPDRLKSVLEAVEELEAEKINITPREASKEELLLAHTPEYIDQILSLEPKGIIMLDPDTAFSPGTREASLKAVGGVPDAVDMITDGKIEKAFCAVRPPGHHAEPGRAMGFCIFNNIAIGAAYSIKNKDYNKVAIVDWDVHHGNGTQKVFYKSKEVLYISLHQYPYYPGTGAESENGDGEGRGYTLNVSMAAGSSDEDYRKAFEEKIIPELEGFGPEIIFISAGFDAHRDDPLAGINLSTEFFGEMTGMLKEIADKFCDGKIISVLEGGYNLRTLKDSAAAHLEELTK